MQVLWVAAYIGLVILLLTVIYMTVYMTYTQLHKQNSTIERFATSKEKCMIYTSDKLAHPWDNKTSWGEACANQDANDIVAGIEVLANIANVASIADISTANLQRLYFPIGTSEALNIEFSKGKYDVYPMHIYVKKDFQVTLTNERGDIKKVFDAHAEVSKEEQIIFKNGKLIVAAIVKEDNSRVDQNARNFVLQGKVQNKQNSTFCITAKKNSQDVVVSECTPDHKEQEWKRDEKGRIVSSTDKSMCLQVGDDNKLFQATCADVPRQIWTTDSLHRLLASNSTTACVQPNGDTAIEGSALVMKDCNKELLQQWLL